MKKKIIKNVLFFELANGVRGYAVREGRRKGMITFGSLYDNGYSVLTGTFSEFIEHFGASVDYLLQFIPECDWRSSEAFETYFNRKETFFN